MIFAIGVSFCVIGLVISSYMIYAEWLLFSFCALYAIGASFVLYTPYEILEDIYPSDHSYNVLVTSVITIGSPIGMFLLL